ncbi:hypothetical protein ACFLW1_00930 [Chloroflexota bacterium]
MAQEQDDRMERRWQKFQEKMGYTDAELSIFRSNPEYVRCMEYAPKFLTHRIVIEVAEAHNCVAGHKAGDRIAILSGEGHIISKTMPERVCAFALLCSIPRIYAVWERFHEDLDPSKLMFTKVHCPDVGCARGGWGEVVLKVYAEEIPKE